MPPIVLPDTTYFSPAFLPNFEKHNLFFSEDGLMFRADTTQTVIQEVRFEGAEKCFSLAHQNWLTILMVVQFFIYCFLLVRYGKVWFERIKNIWRVKQYAGLHINMSEKNVQENFLCLAMTCINLSLFAFLSMTRNNIFYDGNIIVLFFLLLTFVFFCVKQLLTEFVASVFFSRDVVAILRSEIFSLFSYLGLVMYSVLLVMLYAHGATETLFYVGLGVIVVYMLLKIYKLIQVFYVDLGSFFYLFLYLCTLEILPLISLYLGLLLAKGF